MSSTPQECPAYDSVTNNDAMVKSRATPSLFESTKIKSQRIASKGAWLGSATKRNYSE